MIASVRGAVLQIALDHAVIEAAGVGYQVNATPATLSTLRRGAEARLVTALIVREDSQTLYGFPDLEHRDLFVTLLSVSRSEEHTSELQSRGHLVCRLLLEKKKYT